MNKAKRLKFISKSGTCRLTRATLSTPFSCISSNSHIRNYTQGHLSEVATAEDEFSEDGSDGWITDDGSTIVSPNERLSCEQAVISPQLASSEESENFLREQFREIIRGNNIRALVIQNERLCEQAVIPPQLASSEQNETNFLMEQLREMIRSNNIRALVIQNQMIEMAALQAEIEELLKSKASNLDHDPSSIAAAIVVSVPDTSVEISLNTTCDWHPPLKSINPSACKERRVSMKYVKKHCPPMFYEAPIPTLNMYRDFLCNVLPQGYDSSASDLSNSSSDMTTNPLQLPSDLKDFIDRALSTCHLEEDRKCMQEVLIDLIGETYEAGRINIHRWELQCVPDSKTQIHVAPDTASYVEYPSLSPAYDLIPTWQANNAVRVKMFYQQRQKNVAVKPRICGSKSAQRSTESRSVAKITTTSASASLRSTATFGYRGRRGTQHHDASAKPKTLTIKSRLPPLITHNRFELLADDNDYVGGDSHTVLPTTRPNASPICKPTAASLIMPTTRPIVSPTYAPTCAPSVLPTSRPSVSPNEPQRQHPTKIKTQINGGNVLFAPEALNISGNVPALSTQGCESIFDPIATILLLSKDLHYEVIHAAPSANPTIITGPIVPVHRLPSLAIPLSDHAEGGSTGHSDRRVLHPSSSTKTSLRNTFSGKSGENDEFSGKGD
jgi:hypothetical protein